MKIFGNVVTPWTKAIEEEIAKTVKGSSPTNIDGLPTPTESGLEMEIIGTAEAPVLNVIKLNGKAL